MKQFIVDRHTTPNTPTLEQVPTEKIPVYEDMTAAAADLANLAENQIIATHDTGSELSAPVDVVQSGNMHAVSSNAVASALAVSELIELVADNDLEISCRKYGRLIIFTVRTRTTGVHSFALPDGYKCISMAEGLKTALCWGGDFIGEAYILQDGSGIVANGINGANGSGELVTFLA